MSSAPTTLDSDTGEAWVYRIALALVVVGCFQLFMPALLILAKVGIVAALGIKLFQDENSWFAKATTPFLIGILQGCVGLGVSYMAFLHLSSTGLVNIYDLLRLERALFNLTITLKDWTKIALPLFVAIMAFLVVLARTFPRLKPVSLFMSSKSKVSGVVLAMTTASAFTFFGPLMVTPLAEEKFATMENDITESINELTATLRKEWRATGEIVAAKLLMQAASELTEKQSSDYRKLFQNLAAASSDKDFPWIAENLARESSSFAVRFNLKKEDFLRLQNRDSLPTIYEATFDFSILTPTVDTMVGREVNFYKGRAKKIDHLDQYTEFADLLDKELPNAKKEANIRLERKMAISAEVTQALIKVFAETVVGEIPQTDVNILAQEYVKRLVSKFSEYIAEAVAKKTAAASEAKIKSTAETNMDQTIDKREISTLKLSLKTGGQLLLEKLPTHQTISEIVEARQIQETRDKSARVTAEQMRKLKEKIANDGKAGKRRGH